jgi:hypothetical protein
MSVEIKESDFRNLYINTRNIDKKILANMKKNLKKAAMPAVNDSKEAVRAVPNSGSHKLPNAPEPKVGLRESIAASIGVGFKSTKKRAGVFIKVDARKFAAISVAGGRTGKKLGKLPRYFDGRIKRWKHPVFGKDMDHPEKWPVQKNGNFWFERSIGKHIPEFQNAVQKAVDEAFSDIEKKGLL